MGLTLGALSGCGGGEGAPPSEMPSQMLCQAPAVDCSGTCRTLATDPQSCGECGRVCGPDETCADGLCTKPCPLGETVCDGSCFRLATDVSHCGSCDLACPASSFCDKGQCATFCSGTLCSSSSGASICVHPDADPQHCGACGVACGPSEVCEAGQCVVPCATGETRCSATSCANFLTDTRNCGGCGVPCTLGEICSNGVCACPVGKAACEGGCFDLKSDATHCGSCEVTCGANSQCAAGQCVCSDASLSICDGACVDSKTDPAHCGACGTTCASFETCVAGECTYDADGCGGEPLGIDLVRLSLYQAVEVDLYHDGAPIEASARNADAIVGRDAILRGFVEVAPGFASQSVSMRLLVRNGEDEEILFHRKDVTSTSRQDDLASTFVVKIPANLLGPDTTYSVSLASCEAGNETLTKGIVRLPESDEPFALAAKEVGKVKVTFVPIVHDGNVPETSDEALAPYIEALNIQYPIEGIEADVTDPVESGATGASLDLGAILDRAVRPKRSADRPSADTYYYGLIKPTAQLRQYCQGGCTTGVGYVTNSVGRNDIDYRAALGIGYSEEISWGTLPHELGHNHGRNHAPCGVVGEDPTFPYQEASIGSWGYNRTTSQLLAPDRYADFMSYCSPAWISDYTYRALAQRITAVTANAMTSARRLGPETTWWAALDTPSGRSWSTPRTTEGPLDSPLSGVVYDKALTPLAQVEVGKVFFSDGGGYVLLVPPPEPDWYAVGVVDETPFPYPDAPPL